MESTVIKNIHQDLIDQCRAGNSNAQMQVYKLYYKAMYNTSYRMLNNPMDAEDVMQESFLAAFRKIDLYKGDATFGAWLKRIVVNNCIDFLKKKKLDFADVEEGRIPEPEQDNEPVDLAAVKQDVSEVHEAIQELPDGYRTILSMYLLEGYDHEEIAGIMGITSSTSRSQYNRAKKKLLEILKDKAHE